MTNGITNGQGNNVVNTADVDFARSDQDLDDLLRQVRNMGKGTQYYVPKGGP